MYSTDIRITVMEAVKAVTLLLDKNSLNSEAKIFTVKKSLNSFLNQNGGYPNLCYDV